MAFKNRLKSPNPQGRFERLFQKVIWYLFAKRKAVDFSRNKLEKNGLNCKLWDNSMDHEWKNRTTFKALRKISNYMSLLVAQYLALET